jgi:toxin ParE1/3/4
MNAGTAKATIRPRAARDLIEIVQYLDGKTPRSADHFIEEFDHAIRLLCQMPRLGALRCLRGRLKGVRSWPLSRFKNYLIFYKPMDRGIDVVRVLHGARDVEREIRK